MSEEKMYAVKNDKGEWLSFGSSHESVWYTNNPTLFKDRIYAEAQSMGRKARVVELVEAPAKVVVSAEEAEMLERAKVAAFPVHIFDSGAAGSLPGSQDRLMCAYVNGWTVEKPKLYLIKVPHTDDSYFYKIDDEYCNAGDSYHLEGMTDKKRFTDAEIEHYGLQDCERVVCADSARTTVEAKGHD